MFKISTILVMILAAVLCAAAPISMPISTAPAAQQKRAPYGPVISSYLAGLDEELNELEYQLKRDEIGRADYERAKQRLTILRRFLDRYAAENREDIVPEYQALAEDELKTLGLSKEYKIDDLIGGVEMEGQWKVIGVQSASDRKSIRFLVLERLQRGTAGVVGESKLGKTIDPREVIETIVVPDTSSQFLPPPQPSNFSGAKGGTPAEAQKPSLQAPRLQNIPMPEYTLRARDKKIEGEVIVRALFQRDGQIKGAKVEKGLGYGLDDRAIETVKRLTFLPAQLDGKDVDAQARIIVGFSLEKVYVYIGVAEPVDAGQGEKL